MKTKYHIFKPLKGYNSFKLVFEEGKSYRSRNMIISVAKSKGYISDETVSEGSQSLNEIRFGVTISKRVAKKAVIRNRIKRLLRESLRQIMIEQYFEERFDFDEIVFVWKVNPIKTSLIKLEEVKRNMEYLFKKVVSEK